MVITKHGCDYSIYVTSYTLLELRSYINVCICCQGLSFSANAGLQCTALNDALRLIFGYNRWESVRSLRESFGFKSLTELFAIAKARFYSSLCSHHNKVVSHIARYLNVIEVD